jgi:putative transposase
LAGGLDTDLPATGVVLARKSVTQRFKPSAQLLALMHDFKTMTNVCIETGLQKDASTLKRLSLLSYGRLESFHVPSCYKLCAISKAAGILAARKKSIRRGYPTKNPCVKRLILTSCYAFKIANGKLRIPIGDRCFEEVPLVPHTQSVLSAPTLKVNSFTVTEQSLSLSISKEVEEMREIASTVGVDRNLRNLTVGNEQAVTYYDLSKAVEIAENTRSIARSFKRNDARIRGHLTSKYGGRRKNRVQQLLHKVSKHVVESALKNRQAIVFENITQIRGLYRKGNWQGRDYRGRMNAWSFSEVKRQIEYKAAWVGVPVITLSKSETRGTSQVCPKCGERLQSSKQLRRKLWCQKCRTMFDRDLVAAVNIARRGRGRFARSEGGAVEAMVSVFNPSVDAPKLTATGGNKPDHPSS